MRTRRFLRPILLANAAALAVLVGLSLAPSRAPGQVAQPDFRARGEYTMISGRTSAGSRPVVYVVDSANGEVVALRWDNNKQQFNGVGYRSIQTDARAGRGR